MALADATFACDAESALSALSPLPAGQLGTKKN